MSAPLVSGNRMTVAQYLDWAEGQPEGRYELVDGVPSRMSPERNLHAQVKGNVFAALRSAIRASGLDLVVQPDGPTVVIHDGKARQPDVVVQTRHAIDWASMIAGEPVILVEVLSPSTQRTDATDKLGEYFSLASVGHYLLVDPFGRSVIHHRRSPSGVIGSGTINEGRLDLDPPGLAVDVETFFEDLPPGKAN